MGQAETEAELIARLRAELGARPLDQADTCPSWQVYADWLLEHGDARGEWLALALAPGRDPAALQALAQARVREHDVQRGVHGSDALATLHDNRRGWTQWFGPFVLAAIHPDRRAMMDTLGPHGVLLLESRTWTADWLLARHVGTPTLVPVADPTMVAGLSRALRELVLRSRRQEQVLSAEPGEAMPQVYPPIMPINPGPTWDPEAMQRAASEAMASATARTLAQSVALLCCLDQADLRRHADDWQRIAQLGNCLILGPPALLEAWPHPGRMA